MEPIDQWVYIFFYVTLSGLSVFTYYAALRSESKTSAFIKRFMSYYSVFVIGVLVTLNIVQQGVNL